MIRTVLFDLDGTLIDTEKYFRRAWPQALAAFGCTMTDEQALSLRSLGRPFAPERFREMFGEGIDYAAVREKRRQIMEQIIAREGIQLKPGAVELVEYLRSAGYTVAISTATDEERTARYLAQTELPLERFDRFISATMVKQGKPAPDIYLYACEQLGVRPQDCYAVEDAPNGILSASSAGCRVLAVPDQTRPEPELIPLLTGTFDSLLQIIDFLKKQEQRDENGGNI